ncbi:MAG: hypothetical protein R6V62_07125 [Candidatus Fermentibacteraceae bacterium]
MKNLRVPGIAALLLLACCGAQKAPIGVMNKLEVEFIIAVQTRVPGGEWSSNQIESSLRPGVSQSFMAAPGNLEIMATDNLGRTYILRDATLTAEGIVWEVTPDTRAAADSPWAGDCAITITNDLGAWRITKVYCSPSDASEWGDNWITSPIPASESVTINVEPGTYDIRVEDNDGDTYTRWSVEVTPQGFNWSPTLQDIDASGG